MKEIWVHTRLFKYVFYTIIYPEPSTREKLVVEGGGGVVLKFKTIWQSESALKPKTLHAEEEWHDADSKKYSVENLRDRKPCGKERLVQSCS